MPQDVLRRSRAAAGPIAALVVALLLTVAAVVVVLARAPLSIVDEHVHYDYALRVHEGTVPYRGMTYSEDLLQEWACGVGHDGGQPWSCGDPNVSLDTLPSGRYTSGYIHYPSYFVAADLFRRAVAGPLGLTGDPLTALRLFSVVGLLAGLGLCAWGAWVLRLRGAAFLAATLVPSASGIAVLLGVTVNPGAFAVAAGGLAAVAGYWWVTRGRGFWALAAAAVACAMLTTTATLPVVGFGLAAFVVAVRRSRGWTLPGPWVPRVWQVVVLAAITVAPVLVWGRVNAARATVDNAALYAEYEIRGGDTLVGAFLSELAPHSFWEGAPPDRFVGDSWWTSATTGLAAGLTGWTGPVVVVTTLLAVLGVVHLRRPAPVTDAPEPPADDAGVSRWRDPLVVVLAAHLVVFVLMPPLLRLSNAAVFDIDSPIVSRYELSLAPALVLGLLAVVRGPVLARLLAGLSTVVLGAIALGAL